MPVPKFQELALPLLELAADGATHALRDVRDVLADRFHLSVAEREELLPSGRQTRLANRVAWAKVYLEQAGLLASPARGEFAITQRGREVLRDPPRLITIRYLERFPEFAGFRARKRNSGVSTPTPTAPPDWDDTPEEALEAAVESIRTELAGELLTRVKGVSPAAFERLVVELLLAIGYGRAGTEAGTITGGPGDEGIDGMIAVDPLGLDVVYVQAKRWNGTVGRPEIQRFVGALHGRRGHKGVFVTTGTYSDDAVAYIRGIEPRIVLIDGLRLAELMIEHDVGVSVVRTYAIKRIDSDFFES